MVDNLGFRHQLILLIIIQIFNIALLPQHAVDVGLGNPEVRDSVAHMPLQNFLVNINQVSLGDSLHGLSSMHNLIKVEVSLQFLKLIIRNRAILHGHRDIISHLEMLGSNLMDAGHLHVTILLILSQELDQSTISETNEVVL